MKITKITFKNFMVYTTLNLPKGDQEFPKGLILISGKNSHGKSSILQGILFAFFGPGVFTGRNAASFITYGQNKAEIYVYFTLDNSKYYLFRKWGRTGSVTTKLFEEEKKSKSFMEIKQFNISEFFEISKEQALNTVFVRQGEVEELANIKGAKLRDMIIDLFRLNIIEDSLKYLDNQSKSKKLEKSHLEKSRVPIERIEEEIERLNIQNEKNKEFIQKKSKLKEICEKKLATLPSIELISQLETLYNKENVTKSHYNSYKKDFETKITKTDLNLKDFTSIKKISDKLKLLNNSIKEFELKKKEFEQEKQTTNKDIGKTKGRVDDIKSKISKMKSTLLFNQKDGKNVRAKCPTCQSELTMDHYETVIKDFNKELELNQRKLQEISDLIKNVDNDINIQQNRLDRNNKEKILIQSLKDDFENYKKYELDVKNVQKELDIFLAEYLDKFKDPNPEKIKKLSFEIERISTELSSIQNEIKEKQEVFSSNENRIIELIEEIEKMKKLEKEIGDLEVDIEHLNKSKEFVRRFVTEYMVVKRLVKNISLITDKYIKHFTAGQYDDLLLDLTGTTKTGLSLKIKDTFNNHYEPIEVLSGGDRTALGMALRLAISELMAIIRPTKDSPKRNPKINFLMLDEPLAALDEVRRERVLKHLIRSKSFSQIFLITHTEIPSDIQTHKIFVEKDHSNGISNAKFEKFSIKAF